jgi:hypothetical protein
MSAMDTSTHPNPTNKLLETTVEISEDNKVQVDWVEQYVLEIDVSPLFNMINKTF